MNIYKVLNKQQYSIGKYTIVPIRMEDRYDIMKWRNEQIYHLRQKEPLTIQMQDDYFFNTIKPQFEMEKPPQILFSYLKNEECIGYGGLVHINWMDKNAEISFIMDTKLEKNDFHKNWSIFLTMIEQIAFEVLNLNKIYTYAFDLRPQLYKVMEEAGFIKEAHLSKHVLYENRYVDVIIHSKLNMIVK